MNLKKIVISLVIAISAGFSVITILNFLHAGRAEFLSLYRSVPISVYLVAFLIFTSSYIVEALRMMYLLWMRGYRVGFFKALYNNIMGYFFSYLTPFAMGGQPFQVVHLSSLGVDSSYATGIMGLRLLENSIGGAVIALIMLNTSFKWILESGRMIMLGIAISITASLLLLLSMLKPVVLRPVISFVAKTFKLKDLPEKFEEWRERFEDSVNYMMKSNYHLVIVDVLGWFFIVGIQLYSLYYVIVSLVKFHPNFWLIFGAINAVNALAYFVPTPGASGGIELTYQLVISKIISSSESALKAVSVWRFIGYYAQIGLGTVLLAFFKSQWGED